MKILLVSILTLLIGCKNQVSSDSNDIISQNPISACAVTDEINPILPNQVTLADNGSTLSSVEISWIKATDNCEVSHYELAIGSAAGSDDVLSYTNIGNVTSYQSSGVNFDYAKDYFFSLRAVDEKGNQSALVTSSSWQIFNARTLTNLVLWLDASKLNSISDDEGDHPTEANFSNEIASWGDISGSSAVHSFTAVNTKPNWDVTQNAVRFNGSNQFMATADHADINLSTTAQRSLWAVIKTGNNTSNRQIVFEEGGSVRGINIYIEDNQLRCGFWNDKNDGDGTQGYIEVAGAINTNTSYVVSYSLDYSNYSSPNGADGVVSCSLNESSLGSVNTTSRLFPHSGDIGLGSLNQDSYFHDGIASGSEQYYFNGVMYEFLMYNSVHSESESAKLFNTLKQKWSIN